MNKKKITVLLAEDEFYLAEAIKVRLEHEGMAVLLAEDGKQALELLGTTRVDLVIMDLLMPVMDGLEAIRQMKQDSSFQKIPIIVLTAKGRDKDKEESLQAGANAYMLKPFEMKDLVESIHQQLAL